MEFIAALVVGAIALTMIWFLVSLIIAIGYVFFKVLAFLVSIAITAGVLIVSAWVLISFCKLLWEFAMR